MNIIILILFVVLVLTWTYILHLKRQIKLGNTFIAPSMYHELGRKIVLYNYNIKHGVTKGKLLNEINKDIRDLVELEEEVEQL